MREIYYDKEFNIVDSLEHASYVNTFDDNGEQILSALVVDDSKNVKLGTISKGGPGSGSWDGPNDPRFERDETTEGTKRLQDSLVMGIEGPGHVEFVGFKSEGEKESAANIILSQAVLLSERFPQIADCFKQGIGTVPELTLVNKKDLTDQGLPRAQGAEQYGRITIATDLEKERVRDVFRHELGHRMQFNLADWGDEKQVALIDKFDKLYDKMSYGDKLAISRYATTNSTEGFAEAFMKWTNPDYQYHRSGYDLLAFRMPEKVDNIMKGLFGIIHSKKSIAKEWKNFLRGQSNETIRI